MTKAETLAHLKENYPTVEDIKGLIRYYSRHTKITMSKNGKAKKKAELYDELTKHFMVRNGHLVLKAPTGFYADFL